jgi:hypothetical protein
MSTPRNTGRTPLRASRIARVVTALGFAVMVGGIATMTACSDTPSGPVAVQDGTAAYSKDRYEPVATELATPVRVKALLRSEPLRVAKSKSFNVKTHGGVLDWPELGLRVIVPPKAIRGRDIEITVRAVPGDVIAYEFGPEGTKFDEPLTLIQSLKGTNYAKLGGLVRLRGAYFRDAWQINEASNTVLINEFQPTELDVHGWSVKFKVSHFSGYMVSTD